MRRWSLANRTALAWGTVVAWAGCSGSPAPVRPVDVDAGDASTRAIELYDSSGDGALDDAELASVPALLKYKKLYDADSNGTIEKGEIEKRIELWETQGVGFRQLMAVVTLDGRPLAGAQVALEPEGYLTPAVKPARGVTDGDGIASLSVSQADMPPQVAHLQVEGMTGGTFQVKVTHPSKELPAKFNTATTLGEEVAFDTVRERITIQLKSK